MKWLRVKRERNRTSGNVNSIEGIIWTLNSFQYKITTFMYKLRLLNRWHGPTFASFSLTLYLFLSLSLTHLCVCMVIVLVLRAYIYPYNYIQCGRTPISLILKDGWTISNNYNWWTRTYRYKYTHTHKNKHSME